MADTLKQRPQFRNIHVSQIVAYRLPPAGIVSILHRVSGVLMFLLMPFIIWMFDASVTSEVSYGVFKSAFAAGVGFEWKTAEFSRHEAFGSVFFTMTGIHASHVVSGIGILFLVWIQMRRGKFNAKNHWPVSGAIMYWHFVDVVWVFFYPALYLVK